tara:strand:- start:35090 stop:35755 length:666 start_codon:yes stop_codon:yes gene_type:complete
MKHVVSIYFIVVSLFFFESNASDRFGVVLLVKGKVKVVSSGSDKNAAVGMDVAEGDKLTTGAESTAKIVTVDRNVIVVGEKSEIVFEKFQHEDDRKKAVVLDLKEGSVRSSIKEKYEQKEEYYHIKTPTSVAGVRGTDFYVEYDVAAKENVICTFEGKVSYKPNESKMGFLVEAGKFIRHKEGDEVKVIRAKEPWVEKTLKNLEVSGKEEFPSKDKSKVVK